MEDIDGDNGVEGYLYEPERADFLNIQNNLTDDDSSSDNERECSAIEEPKWSWAHGANVAIVYDRKPTMNASVVKNMN